MANIKQQKKRVGIAARQRLENLRYKSAAKTLLKALQDNVNAGDKEAAATSHRELTRLLDRAASRRALHKNTVARKKARAARILVSEPVKESKVVRHKKKAPVRKPKAAAKASEGEATATAAKKPAAKATAAKKPAAKAEPKAAKVEEATAEVVEETTAVVTPEAEATPEVEAEATPEAAATEEAPEATEEAIADDATDDADAK